MNTDHEAGCAEYKSRMSRRSFLGLSVALVSSGLLSVGATEALANVGAGAKLLVVILRGGMDGLNFIVPTSESRYYELRRDLAIQRGVCHDLQNGFGLHPAASFLAQLHREGSLAIGYSGGIPVQNKSHFECQDNLENGLPGNVRNGSGWLNRALQEAGMVGSGIAIGGAPKLMLGPASTLNWSPAFYGPAETGILERLQSLYQSTDNQLWISLARGIEADRIARASSATATQIPDVLEQGFRGAARLLRSPTGPLIAVLSVGGWDTHAAQGTEAGEYFSRVRALDRGIQAFREEIGAAWTNTNVVCVTEFGRTVTTNRSGGTEHGIGMPVIVCGGRSRSNVIGDWPGIAQRDLLNGRDLRPTFDLRSVFKGLLQESLGISRSSLDNVVFPGSAAIPALRS